MPLGARIKASCSTTQSFHAEIFCTPQLFWEREKVTPRNEILFSLHPPPSFSIFPWDVVVPAKYFPFLDVYVFPFFPRIPSTTTTQHVEREGKCVKTLLRPSLPWLFIPSPRGGKEEEEESGRSLIQYPSPPPLRAAATTDVSQPQGGGRPQLKASSSLPPF